MVRPTPQVLQPLPRWIEGNVCLPAGSAAEPGPIKLYKYQRGIAAAIADPHIERVSVIKSARIGYTTLLTSAIAHFVIREPSPILVLMPTEMDCRDLMVSDNEPLFLDSPELAPHLPMPHPGRSDRNTLLHRLFDGGSLKIVAAKAPRNLRRHTAKVLLIDEVDACEASAEGDPVSLAEKRTLSFADRKIVVGSTPLDEATSHVCRLYAQSDMRIWEMPCPACGTFAEVRWVDIEWPEGQPEAAAWRCPACRDLVAERHKRRMLRRGRWRALRPEVVGHAGFKISALVSLLANAAWGKLAAEFLQAKNDPTTLRVFVNTVLGEPWQSDTGDDLDETALRARTESFGLDDIPPEVLALTIGCDVQGDRLEATVCGWGKDGTCYVLAHETLYGAPGEVNGAVWKELDHLLRMRWSHPAGGKLKVDAACVDGGDGGMMDLVGAFCAPRLGQRVFCTKGAPGFARASIQRAKTKGRPLFIVGVDAIKARLFDKLAKSSSIRFSSSLAGEYFEQLSSERRVVRIARGKPTVRFERKPGFDAEALDCLVYAHAAKAALHLNFDLREQELRSPVPPTPAPGVIRSQWMDR